MAATGPALAQPGLTYILYREKHPKKGKLERIRIRNSENFWKGAVKGQHVYFVPDPEDSELNNAKIQIVIEMLPGVNPRTHGPFGTKMILRSRGPHIVVNDTWGFIAWCYLTVVERKRLGTKKGGSKGGVFKNESITYGYNPKMSGFDKTKDGGRPCYTCP